jgi:hypothetical protein
MKSCNLPGPINTINNVNGINIIPPNINVNFLLNGEQSDNILSLFTTIPVETFYKNPYDAKVEYPPFYKNEIRE